MDKKRLPHFVMALRLKPSRGRLLETLAKKKAISKTAVITIALDKMAEEEGLQIPMDEEMEATA